MFEADPYYIRREDFEASWLTDVAKANVATLQAKEQAKEACLD
ncbi:MAG: hypothetical protein AAGA48_20655 [Myxococcota bacterium]